MFLVLAPVNKGKKKSPCYKRFSNKKWQVLMVAAILIGLLYHVLSEDSMFEKRTMMTLVAEQMSTKEVRLKADAEEESLLREEETMKKAQEDSRLKAEEAKQKDKEEEDLLQAAAKQRAEEQEAKQRSEEQEEKKKVEEQEEKKSAKEQKEEKRAEEMAEEESLLREEKEMNKVEEESRLKEEEAQKQAEEETDLLNDQLKIDKEAKAEEEAILETEMMEARLEAVKTCDKRDVSKYDGVHKYKQLSNSTSASGCLTFKCLENNIEKCDNNLPTNFDGTDPPCCTHVMRDMARIFDETMCELGLDYVAAFGTVLGLVRSDRFIPWTEDNDYIVNDSAASALFDLWDTKKTGMAYILQGMPRFCVTGDFAEGKLKKWEKKAQSTNVFHAGSPYIDIYVGRTAANGLFYEKRGCYHKPSDMWPSKRVMVYGNTMYQNLPAKPEEAVKFYYGENWNTPDKSKNKHGMPTGWCVGSRAVK